MVKDLDEEDMLQELSDEEEIKQPTENNTKTDDEIDHEKAKELVLNVETLEQNDDRKETHEEKNRKEEEKSCKAELLESELHRAASGRISIRHGWSSFMRGIHDPAHMIFKETQHQTMYNI